MILLLTKYISSSTLSWVIVLIELKQRYVIVKTQIVNVLKDFWRTLLYLCKKNIYTCLWQFEKKIMNNLKILNKCTKLEEIYTF